MEQNHYRFQLKLRREERMLIFNAKYFERSHLNFDLICI